jgi:hypothetical protein
MELLDHVSPIDDWKHVGSFGLDFLLSGERVDLMLLHQIADNHRRAAGTACLAMDIDRFVFLNRFCDESDRLIDLR